MSRASENSEDPEPDPDGSPLSKLRNIGIAAHIDAGKTTTTERVLYYAGRTHKMGDVDDGTTATDFDEQEQERGITIFSAAVTFPWLDCTVNLIDTPGHVDFTAEVERSLRVLDGAVIVFDAKEGVEPQSETVWRQARHYHVPCLCFINKMDKVGADFHHSITSIRDRLGALAVPVQIPIGAESTFKGLIDLLTMRAYYFQGDELGAKVTEADIPDALLDEAQMWRASLEERVAETDDALMAKYLEETPLEIDEIRAALRRATITRRLHPVFCGSALKFVGVQKLLDGVVHYLPSPLEVPPIKGVKSLEDHAVVDRHPKESDPFAALVFKIVAEKPLDLYYLRIYSGTLRSGSRVFNSNTGQKENLTRIFRMFAKRREPINQAGPGEIVGILGLKDALTGHTLCDQKDPVVLERIEFPEPVISVSVEPQSARDRDELADVLRKMEKQDPTFRYRIDEETGQTLISGMGELHLEVLIYKITHDFRVPVNVGKPRVAYREAITRPAEAEGSFIRQAGAQSMYAVVKIRIEPFQPAEGHETFDFADHSGGLLKREFVEAIRRGLHDAAQLGTLAGYEMLNIRATLLEAKDHPTDSTEVAFESAARLAFNEAVEKAGPIMLEPIMKLQVITPEDYFGVIAADLSSRRGLIQDTEIRGRDRIIHARVPLSTMFEYLTKLRTLSQGRANYSMEPYAYEPMPADLQKELLTRYGY